MGVKKAACNNPAAPLHGRRGSGCVWEEAAEGAPASIFFIEGSRAPTLPLRRPPVGGFFGPLACLWPMLVPCWLMLVPSWAKIASRGPQGRPSWFKLAPSRLKVAQVGPNLGQLRPTWPSKVDCLGILRLKSGQGRLNLGQLRPTLALKNGFLRHFEAQVGSKNSQSCNICRKI